MSRAVRTFLVDGVEYLGVKKAALAIGTTEKSLTTTAYKNEKANGRGSEFALKGHSVQGKEIAKERSPTPENESVIIDTPPHADSHLLEEQLRAVKEQLRYLRECLIGRLHSVDEIADTIRSIEKRVIKGEEKVKGVYHEANGHQAEKLG
jgi:hypothetical protein